MLFFERSKSPPALPFYPKGRFKTSFGPSTEYLVIPAGFPKPSIGPAKPVKDAPTILFLDGILLRFSQWAMQLPFYTTNHALPGFSGHNLVLLNNLGHGESELGDTTKENYLFRCAKAAAELMIALGIERTGIITQSMGTLIGLEFYDLFQQLGGSVEQMAFISPVLCAPIRVFPYKRTIAPQVGRIRRALSDQEFVARLDTFIRASTLPVSLRTWHLFYKVWTGSSVDFAVFSSTITKALSLDAKTFVTAYDAMDSNGDQIGTRLANVSVPVLAILGKRDFVTDYEKTDLLIRALSPNVNVVSLAGCAHWSNSEKPAEVNPILSRFFS